MDNIKTFFEENGYYLAKGVYSPGEVAALDGVSSAGEIDLERNGIAHGHRIAVVGISPEEANRASPGSAAALTDSRKLAPRAACP